METYLSLDSPELKAILRAAKEPLCQVDDARVHELLLADASAYLDYLEQELRDIADGRTALVLPPKAVFEDGPDMGDFRLMPCITRREGRTVKSVKLVGTNLAQREVPDQITVGKAMLLHAEENYVTHLFDASALSSIRTGACTALAIRLLAPQHHRLHFIGAGRVGYYSAFFSCIQGGVSSVRFTDMNPVRAKTLARHFASRYAGIRISAGAASADDTFDVVVLATTSNVPFCKPPAWDAKLVVSVGADTDYQHELDIAWSDRADIVVDTLDSARFGDLRRWLEEKRIRREELRDLFDVLRVPVGIGKPLLFVSTGSALFDNLTMAYLAERLPRQSHNSETKSSNL